MVYQDITDSKEALREFFGVTDDASYRWATLIGELVMDDEGKIELSKEVDHEKGNVFLR